MSPGTSDVPFASITLVAPSQSSSVSLPMAAIRPSLTTTVSASKIGRCKSPLRSNPILRMTSFVPAPGFASSSCAIRHASVCGNKLFHELGKRRRPVARRSTKRFVWFVAHGDDKLSTLGDLRVTEPALGVRLAVPRHRLHVHLPFPVANRLNLQILFVRQVNCCSIKERPTKHVITTDRIHSIKPQRAQHVPRRHLPAVFVPSEPIRI